MSLPGEDYSEPSNTNDHAILENMDLLSLTVRSLELGDAIPKEKEDFHEVDNEETTESSNATKGRLRGLHLSEVSWNSETKEEPEELRTIRLSEVAWHDTLENCWLVIYDFVYDCTDFLRSHPGGMDVLLEYAGRDATLAFIGTGHSIAARQSLERYLIGELPPEERIFRVLGGVKVCGF